MKIYTKHGRIIYDGQVDDNSYSTNGVMSDHNLTLHFQSAVHLEIPIGAYCEFQGERYTLMRPENLKMKHSRAFSYTIIMESDAAKAKIWKFRNPVDGRLKFSLTAKPKEHLQMVVDELNRREGGWSVGQCIDDVEHTISYDHHFIHDALVAQADEFKTEYEIKGKVVSLKKVEYNKSNPLPLSYGFGNGFKEGVGRSNESSNPPVEFLFVQGGTENIDPSDYGNRELLLPAGGEIAYDGEHFEDEDGFNAEQARHYAVTADRLAIKRTDAPINTLSEDSLDCSEIYPKRVGRVSEVVTVDKEKNFYDFIDSSIPEELNFEECLIEGEHMSVIFQSGMLAGREFEVKYFHNLDRKTGKLGRRFEIVPQEIDGETMPNETYKPSAAPADKYAVFKCRLPKSYICDNATKTGAEWDMFKQAVKYKYENEDEKFTFTGTLDGLWAKKDWVNIGGRLVVGGFILFSDPRFQPQGVKVRITAIQQFINNPHSPKITLSNTTIEGSVSGTLKELLSQEVVIQEVRREAISYTKRRFRDAKETSEMLEQLIGKDIEALSQQFTNGITPISVQTMQMIVGDESLQFRYVNSDVNPQPVGDGITYDEANRQLHAPARIVQHLTLGIKSISSSHKDSDYRYWAVEEYTSAKLEDPTKRYYLYIEAPETKASANGKYRLSEKPLPFKTTAGYNLLVGVLNSEYDEVRSFATLYGYTEILPSRITTDKVVSGDGTSFFDMQNNAMKLGDVLDFNTRGDGKLKLKGTLVQSQSGDTSPLGCYRGVYDPKTAYFEGDEVTYKEENVTSTYRRHGEIPTTGVPPTNSNYWQVVAKGGTDGQNGKDGADGQNGKDGVSYTGTEEYYAWGNSSTQRPSNFSLNVIPPKPTDPTYRFLWNFELIRKSDGTFTETTARVIGSDGKGIETIKEYYGISPVPNEPPANWKGWQEAKQVPTKENPFLWNKEVITFTDGTTQTLIHLLAQRGGDGTNGKDGADGQDGQDGEYTEYRFAKNGSTTTPPSLEKTSSYPSGWSTEIPSVSLGWYVWATKARKRNGVILENWCTPFRMTPYDGKDGAKGDKGDSPSCVFRGDFDPNATYYGNSVRLDCVKYGSMYYIAQITAGTFKGRDAYPTNTSKWNEFGANFESVATNLLLAENANVAGWIFKNGILQSENGKSWLNGKTGEMRMKGTLQLSTAYKGIVTDANVLFLPALRTGEVKSLSLTYKKQDIGKVCRFINSSAKGGGRYEISCYERVYISISEGGAESCFCRDQVTYRLEPNEVIEFTCFEIQSSHYDSALSWRCSSRFSRLDWQQEGCRGRFPRILAMGEIVGTNRSVYLNGEYYDGRSASSVFSISRQGEGLYKVTFANGILPSGYYVFMTGSGLNYGGRSPLKGTTDERTQTSFMVHVSDDASRNDGRVFYMICSPYWSEGF